MTKEEINNLYHKDNMSVSQIGLMTGLSTESIAKMLLNKPKEMEHESDHFYTIEEYREFCQKYEDYWTKYWNCEI